MAKCRYCKKKIEDMPFTQGLSKYCNMICYLHYSGQRIKNVKKDDMEPSKARFQPQTDDSVSLSEGTEYVVSKSSRDRFFLEYIRKHPCTVCGANESIHAHHTETGGMGTKGSDYSCVPLCAAHHTSGKYAIHQIGSKNFESHFGIDLKEVQIQLLRGYIRKLYEQKP